MNTNGLMTADNLSFLYKAGIDVIETGGKEIFIGVRKSKTK